MKKQPIRLGQGAFQALQQWGTEIYLYDMAWKEPHKSNQLNPSQIKGYSYQEVEKTYGGIQQR